MTGKTSLDVDESIIILFVYYIVHLLDYVTEDVEKKFR